MIVEHLVARRPEVNRERALADLVPPPRFATATFASYLPDPGHPTQAAAVAGLQAFAAQCSRPAAPIRRWRRRAGPPETRPGIYLDGGFGVGKTHLLAALHGSVPGPKAFGTFVELTHLVGLLGFAPAVNALSGLRLLCVDEFELDDPGDTVLLSTLLGQLVTAGVRLAATSNTLPDRLGEGRFAADDFLREIQGLAGHFDVYRIDGPDYRHRGLPSAPAPLAEQDVIAAAKADPQGWIAHFPELVAHLRTIHPAGYGALLDGVGRLHLTGVTPITDQADALRLVVLADRLYDRDIPVIASGVPLDEIFEAHMLIGGYRKKYFRAISRLVALAREGVGEGQ